MNVRGRVAGITATAVALIVLLVAMDVVVTAARINRVADDPDAARTTLGLRTPAPSDVPLGATDRMNDDVGGSAPDSAASVTTYLVVGSDARPGLGGSRADVVMLGLLPDPSLGRAGLVSLPRDLWVDDLCNGGQQRINAALNGCGDEISGAQLLSLTVENVTGLPVDNYLEIDLQGFETLLDAFRGIEVCTATAVRDVPAGLELPGGCVAPSGAQVLAWVRARHLEEWVDGRWRPVTGVSDLTRNDHQQQVLLQAATSLTENRSLMHMRGYIESLLDVVTLGERLSVERLVADAWAWRHIEAGSVHRPAIPVIGQTSPSGAQVLLSTTDLHEWFDRIVTDLSVSGPS